MRNYSKFESRSLLVHISRTFVGWCAWVGVRLAVVQEGFPEEVIFLELTLVLTLLPACSYLRISMFPMRTASSNCWGRMPGPHRRVSWLASIPGSWPSQTRARLV